MQGFPDIFCYILGVKVTDLVSLIMCVIIILSELHFDIHVDISNFIIDLEGTCKWSVSTKNTNMKKILRMCNTGLIEITKCLLFISY